MITINLMKKNCIILFFLIIAAYPAATAQNNTDYSKIDLHLIRGDYKMVIDTCRQILITDSLNSEIYYKMGLAYQNLISEDKSLECFTTAATLSPDNSTYSFMVAKGLFNKGKMKQAKPILFKLCQSDSLNWAYAYFLTSIYMQEEEYDKSLDIYKRFLKQDSSNYVFYDKIGFASLRKGDFLYSIDQFNRSMALNKKNTNAIKNLAFLYSNTMRVDTAIILLTRGIAIDPEDLDLYVRRANINFLISHTKRALDDYLKLLKTGDTTFIYLKRAGIGYSNNLQPKESNVYLKLAFKKDSTDYETATFLAQNYDKLGKPDTAIYYYKRVLKILDPIVDQASITSIFLAESLKNGGYFKEAIDTYLKCMKTTDDINLYMIVANIYDEQFNDLPKAIYYYQKFVDNLKNARMNFSTDYTDQVKKRLEFLKVKQKEQQTIKKD